MDYLSLVYAAYALVSIGLTVFLAHVLSKNGAVFLERVFADDPRFAASVNQLLVVGFYLVNAGWAASRLTTYAEVESPRRAIEVLATKLGGLLFALAAMHFANLFVFDRIRRSGRRAEMPAPIAPHGAIASSQA